MTAKKAKPNTNASKAKSASAVKRLTLKNGLDVLLIPNHKSPVVSVQMWVKTGSADEQKGEEGISHFIEHLVFKGTNDFSVGEIAATVEASGGELNAYTSFDQTVFYVNISREFSDVALHVISEMMGFPKFDAGEIDNEREVVIEEIKRSNDSPGRQASRLLFSTVYKKHPYGIPVIGYDKIIRKVSRKTLLDYYHRRYIPKNMQLLVAGDFDVATMSKKVSEQFSSFESFKLKKITRKKEPVQTTPRVKVEKSPFQEAQFHLAWRIPGASHKDIAALDVLSMVLGQGDSSRLTRRLRLEEALTNSIGCGTFTPKDTGLFTISGHMNVDQFDTMLVGLREELNKILTHAPQADELKRAVVNLESDEFYGMETIEGIARKAGNFENLMGDYNYFQKFLKQVYALKPEDLTAVARKYLTPKTLTFIMFTPKNEKAIERKLKVWVNQFKKDHSKLSKPGIAKSKSVARKKVSWNVTGGAPASEKIDRYRLRSGALLLFRESHATPVLSARAAFLGGVRSEADRESGLTELVSRTWTSGTRKHSESEISEKIECIAAGLSAFGGRNSCGLSLQAISPFERESIELFGEILSEPHFTDIVVEREKSVMLEAIRSREDNPSQVASQLFHQAMFAGHPYSRDPLGNAETVRGFTSDNADALLKRVASANNLTIAVCGDVDRTRWVDLLESATSLLPRGEITERKFTVSPIDRDHREFRKLEREQTHIILGYRGLTLSDPDRYVLQVMQSVLAGQGGRLFLELRDRASLAYSVSPIHMEGIDTGYFGAYIGCSPEKGSKAIEMLRTEFAKLSDEKILERELDRAKRYLIGRHDIDLQRNSSICGSILFNEIYGIPGEETFAYARRLKDITAESVRDLATRIFKQHTICVAVGPNEPW